MLSPNVGQNSVHVVTWEGAEGVVEELRSLGSANNERIITETIGPAVAKAVKPKASSPLALLRERAIPAPKERMKGMVKGPVTTAPLSKESGKNLGLMS